MRSLKMLGSAAVVALALGLGAASASASGFMAEKFPVLYGGEQVGESWLVTSGGATSCTGIAFGAGGAGPSGEIGFANSQTEDGTCKKTYSTNLKMNGCKFQFHSGAEIAKGKFAGTLDIGPSGCGPISTSTLSCTTTIPAQNGLGVTFENVGSGSTASVTITLNASNLKYTLSTGCPVSAGSYSNGTWSGSWKLYGLDASDGVNPVGVRVAGSVGLFATGGNFDAGTYPAGVLGTQSTLQKFETSSGTAKCETADLNGGLLSATASQVSFEPEYDKCKSFGFAGAIQTNGCQYAVSLGSLQLTCPTGKQLEITSAGGCVVSIASGQKLAGVSSEVVGTGAERKIVASFSAANFTYTNTGVGCSGAGTHNDGVLSGATTLEAIS